MYRPLRFLFFLLDAEKAHYLAMNIFKWFCSFSFIQSFFAKKFSVVHPDLQKAAFGLQFKNSVGLGAGFDKNALYLAELQTLGFGFVEIGTVTPKAQSGNNKPRLFRLKKDLALINRMGFNNDGATAIAARLQNWRKLNKQTAGFLIGGNIGKNKDTTNDDAWKDYEACFKALHPFVDFFVVNVSSPNTPGLRELQEKSSLEKILTHLQILNNGASVQRPILLKISPDLNLDQIEDVIDLALEIKLDGLVATNTTISREGLKTDVRTMGAGGVSGKPLQRRSLEIINFIHQKTGGRLPVIGSGGIFDGYDAQNKFEAGATLVEVWTGFIYEGPFIVRNICMHLLKATENKLIKSSVTKTKV